MNTKEKKVMKQLDRYGKWVSRLGLLGLIAIPVAFILWVWVSFNICGKTLITSGIIILVTQFFSRIINNLKKALKKAEEN